ncbi:MAG: NUDIX hydrolase, partial [Alphaproteobacteria bacterium]|nr:NUDIX hydrolase [Alphaproteobacteria bacterium]
MPGKPKKVDIKSEKTLLDSFIKVEEVDVAHELFKGGMSAIQTREVVLRPAAAAAVVRHKQTQEYVFVRQFRLPAQNGADPWLLELPAGIVEKDEKPEDAITREIEEETGFKPVSLTPLSWFFLSPGWTDEVCYLFEAEVDGEPHPDPGVGEEDLEVIFLTWSE